MDFYLFQNLPALLLQLLLLLLQHRIPQTHLWRIAWLLLELSLNDRALTSVLIRFRESLLSFVTGSTVQENGKWPFLRLSLSLCHFTRKHWLGARLKLIRSQRRVLQEQDT